MSLVLLFVSLFALLLIGVPVAVSLGLASLLYIVIEGIPNVLLIHTMIGGIDSFPLLAIPLFIMAGHLMNSGGITERIFAFARAAVGWLRGGLGHVNVGASVIFSGMSGAAVADAGGLGNVEIKAMRDAGYDAPFAIGLTAASSTIGPIIPPSLPLVVYGVMASVSIGELFVAGIVPGLLMALSLMIMVMWLARRRGYPRDSGIDFCRIWRAFKRAFLPLMTPVIIVGGIVSGVFTPTEAAVAAVAYALLLGAVYKTLSWRRLIQISLETVETSAAILMIVAGAAVFAWILTANQAAELLAGALLGVTSDPRLLLLMMMAIVLLIGLFMETIAAITILVPVLLPVAAAAGIDPVHLGILLILNLMLGLLTPPVGMVLFVLAKISSVSFEQCVRATMPFLIPLLLVLLLVVFVPQTALWLPTLLYR